MAPIFELRDADAAGRIDELEVPEEHVLGLNPAGDVMLASSSDEGGPSALLAIDPSARETVWRAEFEGEAIRGSHADYRPISRDQWGVTVADDRIFAVTGRADSYDWTAVRVVDRTSGERLWSFRAERCLSVRGVAAGSVFPAVSSSSRPNTPRYAR